ncbi:hypothetical protein GC175_29425 [bacterium]|nr:hypothetical protein [bacterium]
MELDNPFFHRGPIRDPRFFWNRTEEVTHARSLLALGQSVSIVGPRRIGKSSLLLHLGTDKASNVDAEPRQDDTRWIYFDCQGWSTATPETLYALLLEAMAAGGIILPDDVPSSVAQIGYRTFRSVVMKVAAAQGRLVLMMDEFESLSANPLLGAAFFSSLRALATTGRVVFVTATTQSLGWLTFAEPSALSSPFFNIFAQINLFPFGVDAATAMFRHFSAAAGAPFADTSIDFILDLAGPHPFFAQMAAYLVFNQMDGKTGELTPTAREQVRVAFLAQAEPHWHYLWQELQPVDQKQIALTLDLATLPPDLLRRLHDLSMVIPTETGRRFLSPTLESFLAQQQVDGVLRAPPITIDTTRQRVLVDGQEIEVATLEYELLLLLFTRTDGVLSQSDIQAQLWPEDAADAENQERLKSVVKTLRRKLGDHAGLVQNVRKRGYILGDGGWP